MHSISSTQKLQANWVFPFLIRNPFVLTFDARFSIQYNFVTTLNNTHHHTHEMMMEKLWALDRIYGFRRQI